MTHCFDRRMALATGLLAPLLLGAGGQPAPPRLREFTPEQQAALTKINAYLNSIHTLKSNFEQLGPSGQLDQGTLYLAKPGRLRFAFQPPSPTTVVANFGYVWVKNSRLNTVDRYSLSNTPLGIILDQNIDLMRNPAVLGVEEQNGALVLKARSSNNQSQSNIALVFSTSPLELRQWMIKDNQGGVTTVALSGTLTGVTLEDSLFDVPRKAPTPLKPG